jgi:predicted NBD/HSP70 family sugar kinase
MFQQVAELGETTRAELAVKTGRARSTVSLYVDQLLDRGLLVELGYASSTGGRPAQLLRINVKAGVILTADLGATAAKLAVTDLAGNVVRSHTNATTFVIDDGPQRVLEWVNQGFLTLLDDAGRTIDDVRAIVVGVPGPVEYSTGTVVRPPIMQGWDACRIPDYFKERYPVRTLVDNDVNLMALGEYHARGAKGDDFLFVKVGTGIGCGIINNGVLHRGAKGAAGDIGHIRVPNADTLCRCGNIGCLEAVAGGLALATALAEKGFDVRTSRDVVRLALGGNAQVLRAVRVASEHIGEVLAALVNFHNPALIVIGGSLAQLDELLLTGVRSGIYQRALPLATGSLAIETSTLRYDAGTAGASNLGRQYVMSPAGIAPLLRN